MGMLESLKEKIEKVTRWKRPSRDDLRHAVKARKPNAFRFKDDGVTAEHNRALRTIPKVALPRKDPVYGRDGPLTRLWRRT
ncbi:MAG: hypothetical protein AUI16_20515 [Alphaproteobacteria bacterium 13_2_20CM_2_64_7]|jgi:hypothetical protein|nr:MAG: hypothetical protein AUI16_20515 [Alphaproteobacteria bacterium 13_2_20CM_2_64_7]